MANWKQALSYARSGLRKNEAGRLLGFETPSNFERALKDAGCAWFVTANLDHADPTRTCPSCERPWFGAGQLCGSCKTQAATLEDGLARVKKQRDALTRFLFREAQQR